MKPALSTNSAYVAAVDIIRIVAITGVVLIHVANPIHSRTDFLGGTTWWTTNLLVSFSRVSIPLFIMLSGFLILQKQESLQETLRRMLTRLFIPYTFWFLIHVRWNAGHPDLAVFDASTLSAYLVGGSYHLYFLVILIGLYAVAPVIRKYLQNTSSRIQSEFLYFSLLVGIGLIALEYFAHQCTGTLFTRWVPFTGFFIAGHLLGMHQVEISKKKLASILFVSWGMVALFSFYNMKQVLVGNSIWQPLGCLTPYFEHYLSPLVVMMSISFFILFFHYKYAFITNHQRLGKLIRLVARLSFGIYLTHLIVIDLVDITFHLGINSFLVPLPFYIPLKLAVVFVISGVISFLLLKFPLTRPLLGEKIQ